MIRSLQAVLALGAMLSVSSAQSFNIDLGLDAGPADTYAAAGRAGEWISVPGTEGVTVTNLVDIKGNTTSARFIQFGGTETLDFNDAAISGDDDALLNDALITHTTIENCMFFNNMDPGRYSVLIYAWMPEQPSIQAVTNVDEEIGNPHLLVGGSWSGAHADGITFSRHVATVAATGIQAGRLGVHSGVPTGGDFTIGAALNGVQILKLDDPDLDGDGVTDGADADLIVGAIAAGNDDLGFDLTGDGNVDLADLSQWLTDAGRVNLPSGNAYLDADANLDGVVDGGDFLVWNANKFSAMAAWTAGDFNADGVVDGGDFLIWNASKFQSTDLNAVPEVHAPWLLLLAAVTLVPRAVAKAL